MFISRAFHINPLQINFYVSLLPAALNFKENMGDHLKNYFQIFFNVSFHVTLSIHLNIFRFLIIKANNYVAIKKKGASLVAQTVKNLTAMQEIHVQSLGWEDPLEKEMDIPVFLPGEFHRQRSLAG